MPTELCPRCGIITNMRVTTSARIEETPEGITGIITTRTFHCETCNSFVRSDDIEGQDLEEP